MKTILLVLMALCYFPALAQNEKINFVLREGKDKAFSIIQIQGIQFIGESNQDEQVKVIFKDGSVAEIIDISNIEKITFSPAGLNIPLRLYLEANPSPDMILTTTFDKIEFDFTGSKDDETPLPEELVFTNNYPNPFNESTTIGFELKNSGIARVDILDIHGSSLAVLSNEFFSGGTHNINWNGRDDFGSPVQNGIYICRIQSACSVVTKKLIVVK